MHRIADEIESTPETLKNAPTETPVNRIDIVSSDRKPQLVWEG